MKKRSEIQRLRVRVGACALSLALVIAFAEEVRPQSSPEQSLTEFEKATHVLNRLGYGPRPGDIERVLDMGIEAYVREQLYPEQIPDPSLESRLAKFETLTMSPSELTEAFPPPAQVRRQRQRSAARRDDVDDSPSRSDREEGPEMDARDRRSMRKARQQRRTIYIELVEARLIRAVHGRRQLEEIMVDFWMNHFNVFFFKNIDQVLVTEFERKAIRPAALGRFEDLLQSTARSPAMLYYLDNWMSSAEEEVVRSRIDERYPGVSRFLDERPGESSPAQRFRQMDGKSRREWVRMGRAERERLRERMRGEAFALRQARGLNENYARELLELHTVGVDGGYTQDDVMAVARIFTGWTMSAPRAGASFQYQPLMHARGDKTVMGWTFRESGMDEGVELLSRLARHPATARFICTKLVRRFVADEPPEALVRRVSARFLETKGDIREVLTTIFDSPEFYSRESFRAKVKKPVELVASSLRALDADLQDARYFVRVLRDLGEPLYACRPPTGYPDVASAWINTNTLLRRLNLSIALASQRIPGVRLDLAAASKLFDQMELPVPDPEQIEKTREMIRASAGPRPLRQRASWEGEIVESAFRLGSPQFQTR